MLHAIGKRSRVAIAIALATAGAAVAVFTTTAATATASCIKLAVEFKLQGLAVFTALQRQGVPSRLVVFPDEGHWIGKPQNAQFWYATFLDWLNTYLK